MNITMNVNTAIDIIESVLIPIYKEYLKKNKIFPYDFHMYLQINFKNIFIILNIIHKSRNM